MKIVCDSCGAKYSIADEKVQGKVFKIRCKKCSNVIVVKGNSSGESAAAPSDAGLGGGSGAAEWYVVIDGEQVGPVTNVEIESYFMSGRIAADTYAWRDGMGDWEHIVEIPEFTHLGQDVAGPNEATTIADQGGYASAGGGGYADDDEVDSTNVMQSPLGNAHSEPTMQDSPGALGYGGDPYPSDPGYGDYNYGSSSEPEDDGGYGGFSGSFESGGGYGGGVGGELAASGDDDGGGMFAAFDTGNDSDFMSFGDSAPKSNGANGSNGHASNGGGGAIASNMVGQRNENSVLFSLSSLDSVQGSSGGGGAPSGAAPADDVPLTEGSGLIDIQALATAHKSMSGSGEGGGLDGGGIDPFAQGTMAMPALMPMGSHRSNKGLIAAAVGGGVLLLGLLTVVVVMLVSKDDTPQQPQIVKEVIVKEKIVENPANQAKAEAEAAEAEKAALAAAEAQPKKVDESEAEESDDKGSSSATSRKRKQRNRAASSQKKDSDDSEKAESKPQKKKDGIDRLLDDLDDKDSKSSSSSKPQKSSAKKKLDRDDVKNTINRYQGRVATCAKSQNSAGKKGTVKVKFFIKPNGRVRGESVVSSGFKGTDVGTCVEKVVASMKFPETSASTDVPVTYPFILR